MKIKVRCDGIIDRCTVPEAVLVAEIRIPREKTPLRYVLLDEEKRSALSAMARQTGIDHDYNRIAHAFAQYPALVRTHSFDSSGTTDGEGLRRGTWPNAESMWVSTRLAEVILRDFYQWRAKNRPQREHAIWAPNWLVMTAVQALAMVAGFRIPRGDDEVVTAAEITGEAVREDHPQ